MSFVIRGLSPEPFRPLFALDDATLAARNIRRVASWVGRVTRTTRSTPTDRPGHTRKISRICRFNQLRRTARFATRFATTKPRRACGKPFSRQCTQKNRPHNFCRAAKTAAKWDGFVRRAARGKRAPGALIRRGAYALWRGGRGSRNDRRGFASGPENHGSAYGELWKVDRCASSSFPETDQNRELYQENKNQGALPHANHATLRQDQRYA